MDLARVLRTSTCCSVRGRHVLVKKSMLHASVRLLVTICALGGSSVRAEVTGLLSITSDYDYRGVSQTGNQAALQLGADYTREHVHCGVWGSNVRFDVGIARAV